MGFNLYYDLNDAYVYTIECRVLTTKYRLANNYTYYYHCSDINDVTAFAALLFLRMSKKLNTKCLPSKEVLFNVADCRLMLS
jgi:hypothetical protein